MKFTVLRESLLKSTKQVAKAISPRTNMPILSNILFELDRDTLTLTGTNIDFTITSKLEVTSDDKGEFTVLGKPFLQLIQNLDEVEITVENRGGTTYISTSRNIYRFQGQPAEDFPRMQNVEGEGIVLKTSDILNGMNFTAFCTAKDDPRAFLNGILWELKGHEHRFVASDAHKLGFYLKEYELSLAQDKKEAIVPKTIVDFLKDTSFEEVVVYFGDNLLKVELPDSSLVTRLIDGPYVPYESVIPQDYTDEVIVSTEEILASLRRVINFTPAGTNLVEIEFKDEMVLHAENREMGEATEHITAEHKGKVQKIGFNGQYLSEIIKHIKSERVVISYSDVNSPVIIKPDKSEDYQLLYLLMPVKL